MNRFIFLILITAFSLNSCDWSKVPDYYKIPKAGSKVFYLNKLLAKKVYDFVKAVQSERKDDVKKHIKDCPKIVNYLTFDNLEFNLIKSSENKKLFELAEHFYLGPQAALTVAAQCYHKDIVIVLLQAGANANIQDWCGNTPLMAACYAGHESIVDELLKHGADVNTNNDGFTALRCTGQAYIDFEVKKRILTKLLKAGADPKIGTPFYDVPIELQPEELKQLLEQHQKNSADN